jgi:hypothetical protein
VALLAKSIKPSWLACPKMPTRNPLATDIIDHLSITTQEDLLENCLLNNLKYLRLAMVDNYHLTKKNASFDPNILTWMESMDSQRRLDF